MELTQQKCEPCREGTPPLSQEQAQQMMSEIHGWTLKDTSIEQTFKLDSFEDAIAFVNRVAVIAHQEDHHPDIHVFYNKVQIVLSTHKIKGLSKNDFIVAAKIDQVVNLVNA